MKLNMLTLLQKTSLEGMRSGKYLQLTLPHIFSVMLEILLKVGVAINLYLVLICSIFNRDFQVFKWRPAQLKWAELNFLAPLTQTASDLFSSVWINCLLCHSFLLCNLIFHPPICTEFSQQFVCTSVGLFFYSSFVPSVFVPSYLNLSGSIHSSISKSANAALLHFLCPTCIY